ncbi:FkbM family methyltransferase [Pinibacter soli]|uniref:FkbM family methyltransferase n=1 Tax=Pinibacter soli TaxID=3044211 RepID=A0ABT6RHA7_9BACT|nr:FkbM family methyltransferase [Pinibacter soli]MDI3321940.1 FkbM family methyltransferase [Pinibacter soli]
MTPTRLKVLKYFLLHQRNGLSTKEMLKFFFDTSYSKKAKRKIASIEAEGKFKKVYFKGYDTPMYYPESMPITSLERVICESFYDANWHYYEIPQTRVSPDDIVVDCGAAEGLFGFIVAPRCKKVYAIEPLKSFCDSLHKTFAQSNNVEILQLGLSSQDGYASISENDIASSLSIGTGEVKVATLDKLFFENNIPVNYIKIDVEGFDVETLKGAKELIKKNKPKIAVTTYHEKSHAEMITELLLSIVPEYNIHTKGIYQETGSPVMLHAWV